MKDAYEVLQQKQTELARVRKEIESLNVVASLLLERDTPGDSDPHSDQSSRSSLRETISQLSSSAAANADNLFSSVETSGSGFWSSLKRATSRAS
jgi:hypothetical protein